MLAVEIEAEVLELEKQLNRYIQLKRDAEKDMCDLEVVIDGIRRKASEIEAGLQETVGRIKTKLSKINNKSKFSVRYMENAQRILFSSHSSSALQRVRKSEENARSRYMELDDEIDRYTLKIASLQRQITMLKNQVR